MTTKEFKHALFCDDLIHWHEITVRIISEKFARSKSDKEKAELNSNRFQLLQEIAMLKNRIIPLRLRLSYTPQAWFEAKQRIVKVYYQYDAPKSRTRRSSRAK